MDFKLVEDITLVNQSLEGSSVAFAEIIRRYQRRIASTIRSVIGDMSQSDLADVSQEIFIQVYRALGGFRGESKFSTYITTIALRYCYREAQKRKKRKFLFFSYDAVTDNESNESMKESFAGDLKTDKGIILSENATAVTKALQKLNEEFRTVLVMRIVEEMSVEEVAQVLNISEGTVKSRLSRAKDKMKEILKNDDFEFYDD